MSSESRWLSSIEDTIDARLPGLCEGRSGRRIDYTGHPGVASASRPRPSDVRPTAGKDADRSGAFRWRRLEVSRGMASGSPLYQQCRQFFVGYPLAVACDDAVRSMVLLLTGGSDIRSFVLSEHSGARPPRYSVGSWPTGDPIVISEDRSIAAPAMVVNALTHGIPMPRHGSLFGWRHRERVTAMVAIYAKYAEASPLPGWSLMPLAGIPFSRWPPFAHEHLFGPWFWEHQRAGRIVSLDGLIARTADIVFWAHTEAILGSGCCVVACDVQSPDGYTLPRGCYVHHQALRAGKPVPSLQALLADAATTDLAGRFS